MTESCAQARKRSGTPAPSTDGQARESLPLLFEQFCRRLFRPLKPKLPLCIGDSPQRAGLLTLHWTGPEGARLAGTIACVRDACGQVNGVLGRAEPEVCFCCRCFSSLPPETTFAKRFCQQPLLPAGSPQRENRCPGSDRTGSDLRTPMRRRAPRAASAALAGSAFQQLVVTDREPRRLRNSSGAPGAASG